MSQNLVQISRKLVSSDSFSSELLLSVSCRPNLLFGLVYFFIHLVTHVTVDTSVTYYNLYFTTQLKYIDIHTL